MMIDLTRQTFEIRVTSLTSSCTSKSFFNKTTLNAQAVVHLDRENEDRIREGFYSALLNRSSILKAKNNFTLFIYIPFQDICE